jgi:hypothetical protein
MIPIAVALTDDRRRKCERVLRAAIRYSDVENLRRAAQETERDERHVARQLAGESGSIRLLMMLPDSFWQWLGVATAQEWGVPKEVKRALLLRRVAMTHKRQLRLSAQKVEKAS